MTRSFRFGSCTEENEEMMEPGSELDSEWAKELDLGDADFNMLVEQQFLIIVECFLEYRQLSKVLSK